MKKTISILMVTILIMSVVGCTDSNLEPNGSLTNNTTGQQSQNPDNSDQANETITLHGWGAYAFNDTTGHTSYNDQMVWDVIAENIGVAIDWTTVTTANGNQNTQFGIIMASQDLPDFFIDISPKTLEQYGMRGALLDLTDYVKNSMPDLTNLTDKDPEAIASITSADGKIYFFPRLLVEEELRCWAGYSIREDWLQQLNLTKPETTDDFKNVLQTFKNDIDTCDKPFTGSINDIRTLIWSFGVGSRGTGNTQDDYFIENKEIKFGPTDPRYKDAVLYIRNLVEEGLIDNSWMSNNGDTIKSNMLGGISGVSFGSFSGMLSTYNSLFDADGNGQPLSSFAPLTGPSAYKGLQGMHTSIDIGYGGSISSKSENADAVAKLFNYTYSEEGRKLVYFGIEDDTYTVANDGSMSYTEKVTSSELGTLAWLREYVSNVSCYPSALHYEHYYATLSEKGQQGNAAASEVARLGDNLKVPAIRFSVEEAETSALILTDINTYVDESFTDFVNGTRDLDEWDDFLAGFDGLRLDELNTIYEAAYERFLASIG